jgi:hypothetical protein
MALVTSCTDTQNKLFDMTIEADFVIPPGLNTLDTHYFIIERVPTRFRNFLLGSPDEIDQILSENAVLSARFTSVDWSIIREISVMAVSINDPNDKREIFYYNLLDFNQRNELRLIRSLPDVRDILNQDFFNLEVRLNFRTITPVEIESRLTMNFIANGKK